MVNRAVELNQPAIALTDHGNLHGAIDIYQSAKKAGIKPLMRGIDHMATRILAGEREDAILEFLCLKFE